MLLLRFRPFPLQTIVASIIKLRNFAGDAIIIIYEGPRPPSNSPTPRLVTPDARLEALGLICPKPGCPVLTMGTRSGGVEIAKMLLEVQSMKLRIQ
eukprot:scaffold84339_cov92-Cyclotella_meneghiniana.AAC.1